MFGMTMFGGNSIKRKGPKPFHTCLQAYRNFCSRWSLTLPSDGITIDRHNWSSYVERVVGFNVCKIMKMAIFSQIKPISHTKKILMQVPWCREVECILSICLLDI